MSEFGSIFKKARGSMGLSLEVIAAETRISTRFLAAIENEDFAALPGGIFNRGFIRAYAERVGLDADQMLAEYERLFHPPEPEAVRQAVPQPAEPGRRLYTIALAALAVVILIFYIVTRDQTPEAATVSTPNAIPSSESQSPEPTPVEIPDTEIAPPAEALDEDGNENPLVVEMEAAEATWIRVAADGMSIVEGEILRPGTTRRYTAHQSIDLTIGNAGGLTLKVNDRDVGPLGRSGQVREVSITPDNADIVG